MNRNFKYFISNLYVFILFSSLFIIGYIIDVNRILLAVIYILFILIYIYSSLINIKNRDKYFPIINRILESEQQEYVLSFLNKRIKVMEKRKVTEKNKIKIEKFNFYKKKIKNNNPLSNDEINELNNIV